MRTRVNFALQYSDGVGLRKMAKESILQPAINNIDLLQHNRWHFTSTLASVYTTNQNQLHSFMMHVYITLRHNQFKCEFIPNFLMQK